MRILVTGSNGQVGQSLVQRLKDKVELLAIDRDQLDITDGKQVSDFVAKFSPDYIINAAAHTAVDKAEQEIELSYAINRDGPRYLAEAAQLCGATLLHISTDYVFDGSKLDEYSETDKPAPVTVYGQTKLAGENAVFEACDKSIVIRTAWVFSEFGNNFVKTMLNLAKSKDELGIIDDQFGGPTYAGDIADCLIGMINQLESKPEHAKYGLYNFSGLPHVSWCQFAQEVFTQAKQQGALASTPMVKAITTAQYPTPAKRPANSRLNLSKISGDYQIVASNWRDALKNIRNYQ
ncbi:dTDP-4-dehydrorhamnose reductase [Alginatibacterium sediminis]|uniref:dTDP-4-dehydrorhamnose reductase n=1 Tax=Alginatibacterium sediminis TaxID=2164068 RepID=A0A420E5L9_9ALTE|nr:dTDP-4-dehydrorhamnose reductase [Alginatibacterium sediminis]RKF13149.1 dTDP-4-dehydrorhamnose reductase [Alginatibacterium sediminis]